MSLTKCAPKTIVVGACDQPVTIQSDGTLLGAESTELVGDTLRINCDGQDNSGSSFTMTGGSLTVGRGSRVGGVSIINGRVHLGGARVWRQGNAVHVKLPANMTIVVNGAPVGTNAGPPRAPASRVLHRIDEAARECVQKISLSGGSHVVLGSTGYTPWLSARALTVRMSSASTLRVGGHLPVATIRIRVSGASNFVGDHKVIASNSVDIVVSGASRVDGVITTASGSVEASGVSNVSLLAPSRESVERDASGMSRITVGPLPETILKHERSGARKRGASATSTESRKRRAKD